MSQSHTFFFLLALFFSSWEVNCQITKDRIYSDFANVQRELIEANDEGDSTVFFNLFESWHSYSIHDKEWVEDTLTNFFDSLLKIAFRPDSIEYYQRGFKIPQYPYYVVSNKIQYSIRDSVFFDVDEFKRSKHSLSTTYVNPSLFVDSNKLLLEDSFYEILIYRVMEERPNEMGESFVRSQIDVPYNHANNGLVSYPQIKRVKVDRNLKTAIFTLRVRSTEFEYKLQYDSKEKQWTGEPSKYSSIK